MTRHPISYVAGVAALAVRASSVTLRRATLERLTLGVLLLGVSPSTSSSVEVSRSEASADESGWDEALEVQPKSQELVLGAGAFRAFCWARATRGAMRDKV